jgi:L-seryl-tRNA(Ser) seleniumtransferase
MDQPGTSFARIPSVDEVLKTGLAAAAVDRFGRPSVVGAIRRRLETLRTALRGGQDIRVGTEEIAAQALETLEAEIRPNVRAVFNLTGTVLHTNLGRAILAEEAVAAATTAMRQALALEFDLEGGRRGERDGLIRGLLCELSGAEDATVVNNNAAAVLLVINTLAKGKDAVVSRGELIEIGGAFRMPDIMTRAGAKLVEVGTTNRTHMKDYEAAVGPKTGLALKVHTSNYRIEGFTKEVSARELAALTMERGVPLVNDLGSGTLVDLSRYGLTHEPTVAESVADGADIVTFSGDKLLGGPQAGFIVGRKDLIAKINKNPLKRALRMDKVRLAALEATLKLYRDSDRLHQRLPTLRMLARSKEEIEAAARRILAAVSGAIGDRFSASVVACASQIGSGALPQEKIASAGIACRARNARGEGRALLTLASAFRALPMPVIGRIDDQAFILDLRCLEDEEGFVRNLANLKRNA